MNLSFLLALAGAAPQLSMTGKGSAQIAQKSGSTLPEQIRIAFGDDPQTSMRIAWQTQAPVRRQAVEYGTTPKLGMTALGRRPSYELETGAIAEVGLQGLKPGTKYFYRVGDPGLAMSEVFSFKTAPSRASRFVFTAFGDHGVTADAAKNVANVVREKPAFHLLLGDISYANGKQPVWDDYLKEIEPMTREIPYMLCLGNHENEKIDDQGTRRVIGYVSTLARFAMPGHEQWYSFDYGCARFVSFNSDDYRNPAQLDWLERTLAEARNNSSVKWLIVMQHHPLYGSSKGRDDNSGLIKSLEPLYDRYKVDLVLCGHDHHYERQFPLRGGRVTSRAMTGYRKGEGSLYIIEGGGGKSLYDFTDPKPDMCAVREKTTGFLRVTVEEKGPLTIESKRVDGSLVEKIQILP